MIDDTTTPTWGLCHDCRGMTWSTSCGSISFLWLLKHSCFGLGSAQLLSGWAPNQTYHDKAAWWLSWIDGLVIVVSETSLQLFLFFKPTILLLQQWSCQKENDAVMFEWEQKSIKNIAIMVSLGKKRLSLTFRGLLSLVMIHSLSHLAGGPRYQCWMVWKWYFDGTIWSAVWRMQ